MPKVMPVAIRDETGAFIRQMAQGNEAMARMYMQLLARYQERLAAQEYRSSERDKTFEHQERMLERREELLRGRKAGDAANLPDNPLGRGANAHPRQQPPAAAPATAAPNAPTAAPPYVPPAYRPGGPSLGNEAPGSRGFVPQGSSSRKFSQLSDEAANAFAQAPRGADHTDFSSQSVTTGPQEPRPERGKVGTIAPKTSAPRDTQRLPNQPKKVQLAEFQPIRREWLDMMAAEEKKHGFPQGTMLTLFGMENAGGKFFGRNGSAFGLFQFTDDLRRSPRLLKSLGRTQPISDEEAMDPAVMIPAAAANLNYNHTRFSVLNGGQKLGNTAEWMPYWTALHQWGEGDGVRIVTTALRGSGHMYAREQMISKNADGSARDRAAILKLNKLDPNITVAGAIQDQATRGNPYHTAGLKVMGNPDAYGTTEDQPPRPPANIPPQQGSMGSNPRLINAVRGGAQLALPNGYTIRQISGYRPGDSGYHGRRAAGDFKIFKPDGTAIPHKGEDTTGLYTRLARGVKTWIQENDPGFQVNWGGAHSTQKRGGTVPDLMHFDTGHDRGNLRPNLRMSQLKPLAPNERNAPVGTQVAAKPQQVAAAPAATKTDAPAATATATAAAPEPFVPTPMEAAGTPQKASITAAMFGAKPSASIADPSRRDAYFSPQPFDKQVGSGMQTRTSSLGPIMPAATGNAFDSGPPKLTAPIMPAATGSEYDSRYSAPMAPIREAATGSEYDSAASAPFLTAPIPPAAEGNEYDAGPPPPLGPIQDAATASEYDTGAPRPAWEERFDPPATSSLPMPDINPQSAAITEAQRMVEADAASTPTATRVPSDAGAAAMPGSGMPGTEVAPEMPGGGADTTPTAPAVPSTPQVPMGEYNPFNYEARARRGASAWQGAKEIPGNAAAVASAMFNTTARGASAESEAMRGLPTGSGMQMPTQLPQGVSDWLANPKFLPDRPNVDAAIGRGIDQVGNVASNAKRNAALFANAVQKWIAVRRAAESKSVKTINPVAPDASSTKPKMHPDARHPQQEPDEPLVLKPKPGSGAPAPFSSGVPLPNTSGGAAATPPMQRKPGTMGTSTQQQGAPTGAPPAGFKYQRVGPGQFIKVPIDAGAAAEEQQQQQELVVE